MSFQEWLTEALEERGVSKRELATRVDRVLYATSSENSSSPETTMNRP